ncbi:MAG TPA: nuclear transport factor 2 family protein [Thermomicrobiales bacterium]|nr:nuclear transport factor 2 family protein [Thermomicrobiales bacterium]
MSARRQYLAVILALALLLLRALGVAAADDPATVFRRFIDLRNQGDVAGALALVTDDTRFSGGPRCTAASPCVGKAAVGASLQDFSTRSHAQATIASGPQVSGTTVRARLEVRDDATRAAGVDRIVTDVTVEMRAGLIANWLSVEDASDPQTARFLAYVRQQQGQSAPGLPNTGGGATAAAPATAAWVGLVGGGALVGLAGWAARRRRAA